MAIYKSMGFSTGRLRISFALRFLIVVTVGVVVGLVLSQLFADGMIAGFFKSFGIGEFHVGFSGLGTILPLLIIPLLFFAFAWVFSSKLKQVSIVTLISENDV